MRFIKKGKYHLTEHETAELKEDFGIEVEGFYLLAPLTKPEWDLIKNERKQK